MPKAEGKYFEFDGEDQINSNFLETFPFDSPNQYIMTETDEFSAVCPCLLYTSPSPRDRG